MIRVTEIVRTCEVCPAQWEGKTDDGRHVYVRYRWGGLTIGIGDTDKEAVEDYDSVFDRQLGDGLDGHLDYDDLKAQTVGIVEWPSVEQVKYAI